MITTRTQTMEQHDDSSEQDTTPTRVLSKPPARSTRNSPSQPLLAYTPQIPRAHPDINTDLLRNKLVLICRQYIPSHLLHSALADGIYARASHWVTPASQAASKHGKRKRYFILHADEFRLQQVGSAWEARVCSGSQPIDAGNGVVLFVKERREWDAFMKGYRRQGKRAGQLMRLREKDTERMWQEQWKRTCNFERSAKREVNAGPMWVLVKSAVGRILRGEA